MPDKAEDDKSKKQNVSRLQKMRDDLGDKEYFPDMPECDARYLVDYLDEIGAGIPNGMGLAPISFLELQAWQEITGIELQPWEARILKRLSLAYCNEVQSASKIDAEPPWIEAPHVKPKQEILISRIKAAFF